VKYQKIIRTFDIAVLVAIVLLLAFPYFVKSK
jgi:hypothetical protein